MSVEENKALARGYFEAFLSNDHAWMDEHIAPEFVRHDPGLPFEVRGPEGVKQLGPALLDPFPDMQLDIEDEVAEGDKVLIRLTLRATHQGEFAEIPPTGRKVEVGVLDLFRISDGKLREQWAMIDSMGLMQQINGES